MAWPGPLLAAVGVQMRMEFLRRTFWAATRQVGARGRGGELDAQGEDPRPVHLAAATSKALPASQHPDPLHTLPARTRKARATGAPHKHTHTSHRAHTP